MFIYILHFSLSPPSLYRWRHCSNKNVWIPASTDSAAGRTTDHAYYVTVAVGEEPRAERFARARNTRCFPSGATETTTRRGNGQQCHIRSQWRILLLMLTRKVPKIEPPLCHFCISCLPKPFVAYRDLTLSRHRTSISCWFNNPKHTNCRRRLAERWRPQVISFLTPTWTWNRT